MPSTSTMGQHSALRPSIPRFSLRTLLIAAAVVPLAFYILAKATPFTASLVVTAVVLMWTGAAVAASVGDGEFNVVARGFAISAAIYAVFAFGIDPYLFSNQFLITRRPLNWLFDSVKLVTITPATQSLPSRYSTFPMHESFGFIGQSYFIVVAGLVGGWFAGWLYRRRQKASQPGTEERRDP